MALFEDFLTTKGQRMIARMLTGEIGNLEFTKLVLGDGEIKNPQEATEIVNPICEVNIKEVTLSDNNVLSITAEFTNTDIESGFYMREKGIYLSDGTEEVLAIYANAGSMASFIEPSASGVIKKVIRSSIAFSQSDNVNVTLKDEGYALSIDFEEHVKNKENPHNVTAEQVGLGNVPNVATNDQTVTYEVAEKIAELSSGEKLASGFGKIAKAVKDLISHLADSTIHFTAEERAKLKGIASGATKVIVDSALNSTSTNPVQNKVIYTALEGKANSVHTHNYAASSSAGGAATQLECEEGTDNIARNVWFSNSGKVGAMCYDNDFKYNPATKELTVESISGNAATATKVTNALTIKANGTSLGTYNGSAAKTFDITPDAIGAASTADPTFTGSFTHTGVEAVSFDASSFSFFGGASNVSGSYSIGGSLNGSAAGLRAASFCGATKATGDNSLTGGYFTEALKCQTAVGHYNNTSNAAASTTSGTGTGTSFVVGNGSYGSLSNAFRVNDNGTVYAKSSTISTGADYAEYFEWADKNENKEDRVGLFVTFDKDSPEKIRIANEEDEYILGIVSGLPSVIGNGDEDWRKRYILDDFGRFIEETYEYEEEVVVGENEDGKPIFDTIIKKGTRWKENPDYDNTQVYIPRDQRPEWSAVGMLGVLSVYDDGTCTVNGYCKCSDGGVATACEKGANVYRVINRVSDDIVKVVFK